MKISDPMLSRSLSEFGSKGGNNRHKNLTPKHKSRIASMGAVARWQSKGITKNEIPRRTNG